jgi:hypothetical protein
MGYNSPPGWIETRPGDSRGRPIGTFHIDRECDLVESADQLVAVSRPLTAKRCPHCARFGDDDEA